jgi:virulence-associated protein VapD
MQCPQSGRAKWNGDWPHAVSYDPVGLSGEGRRKGRLKAAMNQPWIPSKTKHSNLASLLGVSDTGRWPTGMIRGGGRMYAICFDLDQEALKRHYPVPTHTNAYEDIRRGLEKFGFARRQGSVYFGDQHVTPVICVMAVQAVQKQHSWFAKVLTDIRMLRIEEHNDLMPAIGELDLFADQPAPTNAD